VLLDTLWLGDVRKLVTDIPWVLLEVLLLLRGQGSEDLLDAVKLIDL
jgi:hypothetical protein